MRERLTELLQTARAHLGAVMAITGLIWGLVLMSHHAGEWFAAAVLLALGHHWARRLW